MTTGQLYINGAFVAPHASDTLDVVDPALVERLGGGVRVIKQNRGVFDIAPLSLITAQSIAGIGAGLPARSSCRSLVESIWA